MLNGDSLSKLRSFRVPGFIQALVEQHERPQAYTQLSFDERLGLCIESEYSRRAAARVARRVREASLLSNASVDQIDYSAARGLVRSHFLELAQGAWVESAHHLVITGPTGVGKTFIASALVTALCQRGFSARYQRTHEWLAEVALARHDATVAKLRSRLARTQLIIFDEWLREPLSASAARDILDLIDDRYRKTACMFISQLPVTDWHSQIHDPTLADAILDRIVHDALRIELKGESMRKLTSPLTPSK